MNYQMKAHSVFVKAYKPIASFLGSKNEIISFLEPRMIYCKKKTEDVLNCFHKVAVDQSKTVRNFDHSPRIMIIRSIANLEEIVLKFSSTNSFSLVSLLKGNSFSEIVGKPMFRSKQ